MSLLRLKGEINGLPAVKIQEIFKKTMVPSSYP